MATPCSWSRAAVSRRYPSPGEVTRYDAAARGQKSSGPPTGWASATPPRRDRACRWRSRSPGRRPRPAVSTPSPTSPSADQAAVARRAPPTGIHHQGRYTGPTAAASTTSSPTTSGGTRIFLWVRRCATAFSRAKAGSGVVRRCVLVDSAGCGGTARLTAMLTVGGTSAVLPRLARPGAAPGLVGPGW